MGKRKYEKFIKKSLNIKERKRGWVVNNWQCTQSLSYIFSVSAISQKSVLQRIAPFFLIRTENENVEKMLMFILGKVGLSKGQKSPEQLVQS